MAFLHIGHHTAVERRVLLRRPSGFEAVPPLLRTGLTVESGIIRGYLAITVVSMTFRFRLRDGAATLTHSRKSPSQRLTAV